MTFPVTPAKAGVQPRARRYWTPAFAGVTVWDEAA